MRKFSLKIDETEKKKGWHSAKGPLPESYWMSHEDAHTADFYFESVVYCDWSNIVPVDLKIQLKLQQS